MGGNVTELNERQAGPMSEIVDQAETVDAAAADTPARPHVIVLFGATGDLAARKLLPGLLHLPMSGMMPECRIVGTLDSELIDEEFRRLARRACDQFATGKISLLQWANFERRLTFVLPRRSGPTALADHGARQPRPTSAATRDGSTT